MTEVALTNRQPALEAEQPVAVPKRPRLAPGVVLHGEMAGSAYKDPPWLIERGGAYLPVSRLLHIVAEHADGDHTLEEIADSVSDAIERAVTAEDIRHIAGNLVRSGIVRQPDGSVADTGAAAVAPPSPLAVNMKMAMVSPRLIDALSAVLQFLFWWPVVLAVLAATVAIEGWVYVNHGIGSGLRDALYAPGFVLLVLTAIVVAAAFHELGHAAALRYGGGRARAMGVGFYLFYPAFYTDVTENYRLGRGSRLRTDLGGFYFHLIFALGAVAVYLLSGWEPILLIVVLINLEIIHQLMPFVRLDGYWTLADITGIPDFFSLIGPFLRSLVPFGRRSRMPQLKLWAKVVFLLYIVITIPLLLFVLVHILAALPRVLATAWDSFWQQWGSLERALSQSQTLVVAGSLVQMLVLVFMTAGLVFFVVSLMRATAKKVWAWSRRSWPRRVVGSVGMLAALAAGSILFAPVTPLTGERGLLAGVWNFEPIQKGERLTMDGMTRDVLGLPESGSSGAASNPGSSSTSAPGQASPSSSAGASGSPATTSTASVGPSTASSGALGSISPTASSVSTASYAPAPIDTPSPSPSPSPNPSPSSTP
jgi:putative peptide zinc metalloprotease protein